MDNECLHCYTPREGQRLHNRALPLTNLLHFDTLCASGPKVPEDGCGAGGQKKITAKRTPGARFVSVDIWKKSLAHARRMAKAEDIENVHSEIQDV
jgi:cyclopropane fatty-acyl-phospholipid synthase-like methyltransferase